MAVSEIMTTWLVSISPDNTVGDAKAIFEAKPIHHLLVIDEGKLIGVVSDRDVLRNVSPFANTKVQSDKDLFTLSRKIRQIMTPNPITVKNTDGIRDAGKLYIKHNISLLPVVNEKEELVGVLSWKDVMRYIIV